CWSLVRLVTYHLTNEATASSNVRKKFYVIGRPLVGAQSMAELSHKPLTIAVDNALQCHIKPPRECATALSGR
ncbi:MAG: hypothetical protein ABW124_03985, partial [Candidatus Thiodiazotropha sp. 6PLUC9]